jgi:putative endonuclease
MTNNIIARTYQHREGLIEGFTKRYSIKRLVYFEEYSTPGDAIVREKTLKRWPRAWKIALIERENPNWDHLYEGLARWAWLLPFVRRMNGPRVKPGVTKRGSEYLPYRLLPVGTFWRGFSVGVRVGAPAKVPRLSRSARAMSNSRYSRMRLS